MHTIDLAPSNFFFPSKQQFYETCLPQEFSFPNPTIKYMWTTPSSLKAYQRLLHCCKLFFIKHPTLIFGKLNHSGYYGWTYCDAGTRLTYRKQTDVNKLVGKIWVTEMLSIHSKELSKLATNFIPRIYQCCIIKLVLYRQNLSYDELKFLSNGAKEFTLGYNLVEYDNGEQVPLEEVVKLFSNSKKVNMYFGNFSRTSKCDNYDLLVNVCKTIEKVDLDNLTNEFDFQRFYELLKDSNIRSLISSNSNNPIERLDLIIDEILQTESFSFVPPVVYYDGIGRYTYRRMLNVQKSVAEKYC